MNENLAVTSETFSATELFVTGSGFPVVTDSVTIASGQNLTRGTVLGKITNGAATVAAAGAGEAGANTGDGTLTMNATTPILAGAKAGVYSVKCTTAATNGGTFRVFDPDGYVLGDVAVGATFANGIKFAIADGAGADFAAGDGFAVTIAAGAGSYNAVNSANIDGSDAPVAVLASDANATDGAVVAPVYLTGEFNAASLVFGGSDTYATHKDALRKIGIFVKTVA